MSHLNHCIHHLLPSDRKAKQWMTQIKRFLTQYWRQVILVNWWRHSFGDFFFFFWSHGQHGPWSLSRIVSIWFCLRSLMPHISDLYNTTSKCHQSIFVYRSSRTTLDHPRPFQTNNNVFNSRSSGILQICPNTWSFLIQIVSTSLFLYVVQCSYLFISSSILPFHCQNTSVSPNLKCK